MQPFHCDSDQVEEASCLQPPWSCLGCPPPHLSRTYPSHPPPTAPTVHRQGLPDMDRALCGTLRTGPHPAQQPPLPVHTCAARCKQEVGFLRVQKAQASWPWTNAKPQVQVGPLSSSTGPRPALCLSPCPQVPRVPPMAIICGQCWAPSTLSTMRKAPPQQAPCVPRAGGTEWERGTGAGEGAHRKQAEQPCGTSGTLS